MKSKCQILVLVFISFGTLIGGDKTGDNRWYETHVPIADQLYDVHLEELKKEGNQNG